MLTESHCLLIDDLDIAMRMMRKVREHCSHKFFHHSTELWRHDLYRRLDMLTNNTELRTYTRNVISGRFKELLGEEE